MTLDGSSGSFSFIQQLTQIQDTNTFFVLPEVVKMSIKPRNGEFYLIKSSLEYHEVIMCVYCFPEQRIKT